MATTLFPALGQDVEFDHSVTGRTEQGIVVEVWENAGIVVVRTVHGVEHDLLPELVTDLVVERPLAMV